MSAPYDPAGDDLGAACLAYSTAICEIALSHLGNTASVAPGTPSTNVESLLCSRYYAGAVEETLREWDWPAFKRYATLEIVVGSEDEPVNGDWIYAFRQPDNCLKVRRIVDPATGRAFTANPPPWEKGTLDTSVVVHPAVAAWSDAITYNIGDVVTSGGTAYRALLRNINHQPSDATYWVLVAAWSAIVSYSIGTVVTHTAVLYVCIAAHTNHAPPNATYWTAIAAGFTSTVSDGRRVVFTNARNQDTTDDAPALDIEYTYRPDCTALVADSLFKRALAWLMAAKLAPSSSRNKITAAEAMGVFYRLIQQAKTVDANEKQTFTGELQEGNAPWIDAR